MTEVCEIEVSSAGIDRSSGPGRSDPLRSQNGRGRSGLLIAFCTFYVKYVEIYEKDWNVAGNCF
jgi:hypothetical protein